MTRRPIAFPLLVAFLGAALATLFALVFFYAPLAQAGAGGLAQKIFYFHVPSAYAMYLSAVGCFAGSAAYLVRPSALRDAWMKAGAECAVLFGLIVLTSGPLWAKKAWGVYWTWDPRLTTLLLSVLVYAAIVVLGTFAGEDDAERRFLAAVGVLGTVNLPIIHLSVQKWGGNHPTVITSRGGGISTEMAQVLGVGFLAMTLLTLVLFHLRVTALTQRARLLQLEAKVALQDIDALGSP
jgi:heme exporter protein C